LGWIEPGREAAVKAGRVRSPASGKFGVGFVGFIIQLIRRVIGPIGIKSSFAMNYAISIWSYIIQLV
jgi:hypothetical protein